MFNVVSIIVASISGAALSIIVALFLYLACPMLGNICPFK